jgi:Putative F0F1-ATPase subunit Ca2+/Mg2+ transporter
MGAAGAALGLGCSIVVSVVFFIAGGALLDAKMGTGPVFTLIGVVLALAAAGYQLVELSRVGRSDRRPGPLTRGLERLPMRRGPTETHEEE